MTHLLDHMTSFFRYHGNDEGVYADVTEEGGDQKSVEKGVEVYWGGHLGGKLYTALNLQSDFVAERRTPPVRVCGKVGVVKGWDYLRLDRIYNILHSFLHILLDLFSTVYVRV